MAEDPPVTDLTASVVPKAECSVECKQPGVYLAKIIGHANGDTAQQVNALLKGHQAAMKADMAAKRDILIAMDFSGATAVEDTFVTFMLKLSNMLRNAKGNIAALNVSAENSAPFRKTRVPHLINATSLEDAIAEQKGEGGELDLAP